MRLSSLAFVLLPLATAAPTLAAPPPAAPTELPPGVAVVKAAAIADKIEKAPPAPGGRGGVIAQDEGYRVHVSERDVPGQAELHDGDTDVWYVMAGGATVVMGGTIVDSSVSGTGEHRGPSIRGGTDLAVSAGDVITIRPGVAHWVKSVDGRLRYMVVKVHSHPAAAGAK